MDHDTDHKDNEQENIEMEKMELDDAPPPVDAIVHVSVANDHLEASINIEPPLNGGERPNMEMIQAALEKSGITYNIDTKRLGEIVQLPPYNEDVPIAKGTAPVNGVDGTIRFEFETDTSKLRPKENADGTVDFHDLGIVQNVKQGQVLAVITLPTEGTPRHVGQGKRAEPEKGQVRPLLCGQEHRAQ